MKTPQFIKLLPAFILMTCFFACKKGDIGPQGPKGDTGEQGPKGDKGSNGTANVLYSDWLKIPSFTTSTVYSIKHFYYNKAVPQITDQLLNTGTVLVYVKLEGYVSSIWPIGQTAQLPLSIVWKSGNISCTDSWTALCTKGNIKIDMVNSENYYLTLPGNSHSFRYIIIPGGVRTSVTGLNQITINNRNYTEDQLKAMPYEQVATMLNIK